MRDSSSTRPDFSIRRVDRGALLRLLLVTLALGGLTGYAVYRCQVRDVHAVRTLAMSGEWIRPPGEPAHSGYFRRRLSLPGPVKHAWMAIAARDSFDAAVNGVPIGQNLIWRQSQQFQYFLSEPGQALQKVLPAIELTYPREYQWSGDRNELLPVFFDLTARLVPGDNVITIEIESRGAPALIRLDSEVELWSGQRLRFDSGPSWRAEPVPLARPPLDWSEVHYPDLDWHEALACPREERDEIHYRTFDPRMMTTAFRGDWLRHPEAPAGDAVWFEANWELEEQPPEAWIRIAVNRPFDVFINGRLAGVTMFPALPDLDNGDWLYAIRRNNFSLIDPEQLDVSEIGSVFTGGEPRVPEAIPGQDHRDPEPGTTKKTFSVRRHGDLASRSFRRDDSMLNRNRAEAPAAKSNESTLYDLKADGKPGQSARQLIGPEDRTGVPLLQEHSQPLPTFGPVVSPPEGGIQVFQEALSPFPADSTTKALARDRAMGAVYAFGVAQMLRRGRNTIAIRLAAPRVNSQLNWPAQVAIDAEATSPTGARWTLATSAAQGSTCYQQDRLGRCSTRVIAVAMGPACSAAAQRKFTPAFGVREDHGQIIPPDDKLGTWVFLPEIIYRGQVCHASDELAEEVLWVGGTAALVWLAIAATLVLWSNIESPEAFDAKVRSMTGIFAIPALVLAIAVLIDVSWLERYKSLYFQLPEAWPLVLMLAVMTMTIVAMAGRENRRPSIKEWEILEHGANARQGKKVRLLLLMATLIACGWLRIHKLDYQPLHDDEYTSLQAILMIARTGLPRFDAEGVWYSRSPFYHYLVGAIVRLCGENLWSFRLPTVWFAVATALLLYVFGSKLLNRPWVGLAAAALFAIHPVTVFTGHMIRFYEQQSFFSLLAVYWFCRGYVVGNSQSYRYLTLAALLAAVLSQEIAAVMGPQMVMAVLLFGRDNGRSANIKLLLAGCCAVMAIGLDYLVFQTWCLTRLEGVSPNMEASIQLHFWYPYYFGSLFIGYSRIHLLLSTILLLSLPSVLKSGNRVLWALLWFLFSGIALSNLLITTLGFRYIYRFVPLLILLSVYGVDVVSSGLARLSSDVRAAAGGLRFLHTASAIVLLAGIILSWSPWRILSSYETKLLADCTGAIQYVRSQAREGDVVIPHEPLASAYTLEGGKVDYVFMLPVYHDFFIWERGRLVDRNSAMEVVGSLGQLIDVCKRSPRVWIILNREKFRSKGQEVLWGTPGSRVELFLRKNLELKYSSLSWVVYLWDAGKGHYSRFRENGG